MLEDLKQKINSRKIKIAVIGLGYVGLPLAVNFAKKGFKVYGIDKDADRVAKVKEKKSYISDVLNSDLVSVVVKRNLDATTDFSILKVIDVIIICVPTPLKRRYTPDISFILNSVRAISKYLKKHSLVVLESTTYPGTTEELILPILEANGLRLNEDFYLSFSPERIDPGNKKHVVTSIPKIVGGLTPESTELTALLYRQIIKKVFPVSSAKTAEMTKLLENSFRIINIGWINEVAMMCHKMDIDIWEVIEAAKTKPFGFMPFYPGLGVGGHCIPDDPLYLFWKAKHHGFSSKFIKLAADVNSGMPKYAVSYLEDHLKKNGISLKNANILVVGVTYKKDVKDLRKSPPLKFIEILKLYKCKVSYHDPIISYLNIDGIKLKSVELTKKIVDVFDCVVIAADHTDVNYHLILQSARMIFDIRNVYAHVKDPKIIKL